MMRICGKLIPPKAIKWMRRAHALAVIRKKERKKRIHFVFLIFEFTLVYLLFVLKVEYNFRRRKS